MRKWFRLLLYIIGSTIFGFALLGLAFALFFTAIGFVNFDKHTYTLDEIGQAIDSPIPADATDIQFSSETRYGYFIKLSFAASPANALTFAKRICGEILYQSYDPFNAIDSFASKPNDVLVKWGEYAYFSHSQNRGQAVYGYRCTLGFSVAQVRVDQTDATKYQIRFELLGDGCAIQLTCSPYSLENSAKRPLLSQDSPIPFIVYGFEDNRDAYILDGYELCAETDPGLYRAWITPPFDLNSLENAAFELFVDGVSMGNARIIKGLLSVDYSTGKFLGIHESPEYCFQVDSAAGIHKMSIEVKTVAGKQYQYSWSFQVKTSS